MHLTDVDGFRTWNLPRNVCQTCRRPPPETRKTIRPDIESRSWRDDSRRIPASPAIFRARTAPHVPARRARLPTPAEDCYSGTPSMAARSITQKSDRIRYRHPSPSITRIKPLLLHRDAHGSNEIRLLCRSSTGPEGWPPSSCWMASVISPVTR